jgi:hypothetical protein
MTLHLDYETACDLDLTKVGLDRYSSHPSCRVLMAAYRIGDGQLQQWEQRDGRFPRELEEALLDPAVERWAFNAQFERVISRRVLEDPHAESRLALLDVPLLHAQLHGRLGGGRRADGLARRGAETEGRQAADPAVLDATDDQ